MRENLSRSLMQSVTSVKEENKSQIVHLNDEIDNRDKIIKELQSKLAEAVREINDGAAMIEKLQASAKRYTLYFNCYPCINCDKTNIVWF